MRYSHCLAGRLGQQSGGQASCRGRTHSFQQVPRGPSISSDILHVRVAHTSGLVIMPRRTTPLVTGEYYHIYNRGVDRQPTFFNSRDHRRFLDTMAYYRFYESRIRFSHLVQLSTADRTSRLQEMRITAKSRVTIICFALMPNHFHLVLQQRLDGGISAFMRRLADSYTKYMNVKHRRVGPLFQGAFKAVRIQTDAQLLHVSRYIHLNPVSGHVVSASAWWSYPWSSLADYQRGRSDVLDLQPVLGQFASLAAYEKFMSAHIEHAQHLKRIRHLLLDYTRDTPDV